jgi:hypothetical protein
VLKSLKRYCGGAGAGRGRRGGAEKRKTSGFTHARRGVRGHHQRMQQDIFASLLPAGAPKKLYVIAAALEALAMAIMLTASAAAVIEPGKFTFTIRNCLNSRLGGTIRANRYHS